MVYLNYSVRKMSDLESLKRRLDELEKQNAELSALVMPKVQICGTCLFFKPTKPNPKPDDNRFCVKEGPLDFKHGRCVSWKLEPDATQWRRVMLR